MSFPVTDRAIHSRLGADRRPPRARPTSVPMPPAPAFVAVALGIALLIDQIVDLENVSLVFLAAVLAVAVRFGVWPSLYAAFVSVLCYNFFFLPPLYTFTIADPANVIALFFFLIVAVLDQRPAGASPRPGGRSRKTRARTTRGTLWLQPKLAGIADLDDLLWATAHQIAVDAERCEVVLLMPEGRDHRRRAPAFRRRTGSTKPISPRRAGPGSTTSPPDAAPTRCPAPSACSCRCAPAAAPSASSASTAPRQAPLLTPDERRLLDALADQAAVAIERMQLAEDIDQARLRPRRERLRAALLTSISHDLRTPLASIIGARPSLRSYSRQAVRRADARRAAGDDASRKPSGSTASSPTSST